MLTEDLIVDFDFEVFSSPLADERPSGEDLKYSQLFRDIEEARRGDDLSLPTGVWQASPKKSEWSTVERMCRDALMNVSKDIRLVAWLSEAWIKLYGVRALSAALRLYCVMHTVFWDTFYPQIDDDQAELRLAAFEKGINLLIQALVSVPFFSSEKESVVTLAVYRQAVYAMRFQEQTQNTFAQDQISLNLLNEILAQAPPRDIDSLLQSMTSARTMMQYLRELCETLPYPEQPGLYRLRDILDEMSGILGRYQPKLTVVSSLAEIKAEADKVQSNESMQIISSQDDSTIDMQPLMASPSQTIPTYFQNRDQAYKTLGIIADFLQKEEPHSPASFLIRRAIAWGEMNLPELFDELFQEGQDIAQVRRLLGF